MKKLFLLAACCASSMLLHAQTGFFLQPEIGAGVSKIVALEDNRGMCDCGVTRGKQTAQVSLSAAIKGGYQFKFFRFTTGLELLRTSALQHARFDYFPSGVLYTTPVSDRYSHYDHLFIPLSMTLIMMPINKTWAITPELGTRIAYLSQNGKHMIGGFLFSGRLNVEMKIADNLKLLLSPTYYRTVSPLSLVDGSGTIDGERAANAIFQVEGSVLWYFHPTNSPKEKKAAASPL